VKAQERIYTLSKGVESLTVEEHGRFFEAVQRLGLSNEVKQAAIVLYLDFKARPIGEYNEKNLDIFLLASVSLAAKALGELRTDHEFESKMLTSRERLVDAEDRILRSFRIQDSVVPITELVSQLTKREIESMTDSFVARDLISGLEREQLVEHCFEYLDRVIEKGLSPKMSYRGRAAGVMLNAVRELGLQIPVTDIARAAGFDKRTMAVNADVIGALLRN
jgi:hypothetical protein